MRARPFLLVPFALSLVHCSKSAAEVRSPVASKAALPDTATLSAAALDIAGFSFDSARIVPWRTSANVPARLMLDPAAVQAIGSIVEGRITHVLVRVGDAVRAGDVLVMIHSHEIMDARATLVRATSQLMAAGADRELARSASARAARLLEAKAMSRAEVERADAVRQTADAMYEQAVAEKERAQGFVDHLIGEGPTPKDADIHDVLIRSAVSGVVTERVAQAGTVVLPGTPLVTVADPTRLQLQMRLSERATDGVRVGSRVRYTLTDDATREYEAVVSRVAPTVDTLTRTIEVLATPVQGAVVGRAEAYAQAAVGGAAGTPALIVPAAAVQAMDGDTVVITADQRGSGLFLQAVRVRVGRRSANHVEVLSGLGEGRRVVIGSVAIAKAELLKRRTVGAAE